jgi:hypothetical protein
MDGASTTVDHLNYTTGGFKKQPFLLQFETFYDQRQGIACLIQVDLIARAEVWLDDDCHWG